MGCRSSGELIHSDPSGSGRYTHDGHGSNGEIRLQVSGSGVEALTSTGGVDWNQ